MFNLWKALKRAVSVKVASREQDLDRARDDDKLSIQDGYSVPSALAESHGKEPDMSISMMLEKDRGDTPDMLVEGRLDKKSSEDRGLVSRQNPEGKPITDMAAESERWDSIFREAYADAKKGKRDLFSLHFDTGSVRVPEVDADDSLIVNRPGRITDFGGIPGPDADENLKNIGKQPTIKEAESKLRDIDYRSFQIRLAAAKQERGLFDFESDELVELSDRKREILTELSRVIN